MVANRGVGVRQLSTTGTTPKEHRLTIAGMMAENAPGTPRSGLLNPASTNIVFPKANMSYDVLACAAVILRDQDEGVYTPTTTGVTNVLTGNAPSSGSRWDIVWIKQNDPEKQDNDGGTPAVNLNTAMVRVTQGQAAASPVKPAIPAGAYALSEHQIFSGMTATNASPNTSRQLWRYTVPRGAPIPVRNQAERDEISPVLGTTVLRLDQGGLIESRDGVGYSGSRQFVTLRNVELRFAPGTQRSIGNPTEQSAETVANDFLVPASGDDTFRFTRPGLYQIEFTPIGRSQSSAGVCTILRNGGQLAETGFGGQRAWSMSLVTTVLAASGDRISIMITSTNEWYAIPIVRVVRIG